MGIVVLHPYYRSPRLRAQTGCRDMKKPEITGENQDTNSRDSFLGDARFVRASWAIVGGDEAARQCPATVRCGQQ